MKAIILAGGQSSRMGVSKAFLELGGCQLIQRVLDVLTTLFTDVLLVTNEPEAYAFLKVPMVRDSFKGKGPLGGIEAGLSASQAERNFIVAADMPFLQPEIITALIHRALMHPESEVVVPRWQKGIEPLHAVYHRRALPVIKQCLLQGELRINACFPYLRVEYLDLLDWEQETLQKAFFNINTPEDLRRAEEWIKLCQMSRR